MEGMTIKRKIKSTTKSNTVYISNSHSITAFTKDPPKQQLKISCFFLKAKYKTQKKKKAATNQRSISQICQRYFKKFTI